MTEPIDPVRLATIRNNHAYDQRKGFLLQADNRDLGDLLGEVDRLTGNMRAIRGWIRSRREILDTISPKNGHNDAKTAILNDLDRVLDDLEILKDEV